MKTADFESSITITVPDHESMYRQLDAAVATAREQAMRERDRGILVTRHALDTFTIELSAEVPFGLTVECQNW